MTSMGTRPSSSRARIAPIVLSALALAGAYRVSAAGVRSADGGSGDWCFNAADHRIENSAVRLSCGTCDGASFPTGCFTTADCWSGGVCSGSTDEVVWYDARTDGTPNDLKTIAAAQDEFALYFILEFWDGVDHGLLPHGQLAIDFQPGGTHDLIDPFDGMVAPGFCSASTDRACTEDEDCHFCTADYELPVCCDFGGCTAGQFCRVRACGIGCTLSECDSSQICQNLGATPLSRVGVGSSPAIQADYLLVFDFGIWVLGGDAVQLNRWSGVWSPLETFFLAASGGAPEYDPPLFEVEIPWSAFGCSGWTEADGCGPGATAATCACPDFGPGTEFRHTFVVARGELTLDFKPRGAIEDVFSEALAGTTTLTTDSCPGTGIGTTQCELADAGTDTFLPRPSSPPGGRVEGLTVAWAVGIGSPAVVMNWSPSCSSGDTDYEVYEGDLAAFPTYDHEPKICSTSGATSAMFNVGQGDRYYLVVPTDGSEEGSYGVDGAGVARPASTNACRSQVAAPACP